MTLTIFLLLCVLILPGLWLGMYRRDQSKMLGFPARPFIWSVVWLVLGGAGIWLVNAYTYPSNPDRFFPNTAYHVLEHEGFVFQDTLNLVDDTNPAASLLDGKEGMLTLRGGQKPQLKHRNFYEPIFVREAQGYHLDNAPKSWVIKPDLELKGPQGFYLAMEIQEDLNADTAAYTFQFAPKGEKKRSEFNLLLSRGYPLADIVRRVPGWEAFPDLGRWLEGAKLVRENYGDPTSPLYYFPTRLQADSIHLGTLDWKGRTNLEPDQDFFLGLGLDRGPVMTLEVQDKKTLLRYRFPPKYHLDSKPENDLFVCSNFSDVAQNAIQGGYFFPLLREEENQFHINAGIKYLTGNAQTELQLQVIDHQRPGSEKAKRIWGGDTFKLFARDGKTQWQFHLEDLRASSPIGPWHLRGFVFLFVALVLFTLHQMGPKGINPFEPAIYILVFAFLTVRILLQWRMAVFPPVEDVSLGEWNFLRSGRHFYITLGITVLWFAIRLIVLPAGKTKGIWQSFLERIEDGKESLNKWLEQNPVWNWIRDGLESDRWLPFVLRYGALFISGFILLAGLRLLGLSQVERFMNIAYPIGFFFLVEYIHLKYRNHSKKFRYRGIDPFALFNAIFTAFYLALSDAGFSIIFLLFLLLWEAVRAVHEAVQGKQRKKPRPFWTKAIICIAVLFLLILFADQLIGFIFNQSAWFYWTFILPITGISTWYFAGVVLRDRDIEGWKWQLIPVAGILALMTIVSPIGIQKIQDLSYVKYRAAIHWQNLDDIIAEEAFDSGEMGQILRAAQNQWFINNYLRPADEQSPSKAFNLKPHFNKGSSYTTQTTDLVVTRYIISEHSSAVLLFLVLLLLLAPALFILTFSVRKDQLMAPLGALLLLFAIALFIWLTATNRFVFFGQDFPMVSLTSLFTLVFSLGILLFALYQAQGAKVESFSFRPLLVLPFGALLAYVFFLSINRNLLEEGKFDFNLSLDQAKADFDRLDQEFIYFQDTLQTEMGTDSLLQTFYAALPDKKISDQPFSQSVFEHLVLNQEVKTDPEELLHLVSRNGTYRFALNRSYFLIQPPKKQGYDWEGNLYAANEGSGAYLLDLGDRSRRLRIPVKGLGTNFEGSIEDRKDRINFATVPPTWTPPDQAGMVLAWAEQTEDKGEAFTITNSQNGAAQYSHDFSSPAIRLTANDYIVFPDASGTPLRFQYLEDYRHYLAKNIWLNGEQRLFYPLGDKLLWAYYYANSVRSAYKGTAQRQQDVSVSIDYGLTEALSEKVGARFKANKWEDQRLGVVAINGDGQLRLLLDHHKGQIDPNDIRDFNEKTREFYLRNNNRLERETFGNINLLKLQNGPGSTLKPIVYAAVSSQYNLGWSRLDVAATPGDVLRAVRTDEKQEEVKWFGGKEINLSWSGINDGDLARIPPRDYIVKSKNLYHSMVMFLGSYAKEDLEKRLSWQILLPPDASKPELNFPLLSYKGAIKRFNPEFWPRTNPNSSTYFGNKSSLLALGLMDNFDLPTFGKRDRPQSQHQDFDPDSKDIFSASRLGYVLYGYPENSYFYQIDRAVQGHYWFIKGMKQVTAGADPIRVTPLKMAEMTGKLFHFNPSFQVSLSDTVANNRNLVWDADSSWQGEYLPFVQEYLYGSMRSVVQNGTAGPLGSLIRGWKSPYYYYGKTGTIGNAEDEDSIDDKFLSLVISKGNLQEMSPQEIQSNKFYVLFISGMKLDIQPSNERWAMIADVVKEVEASYLFKSYMNGEE